MRLWRQVHTSETLGLADRAPALKDPRCRTLVHAIGRHVRLYRPAERLLALHIAGWLAVVLVQHLRAASAHEGFLTTFYGVAPNLIMGFCTPSILLLHRARVRARLPTISDFGWFVLCTALGTAAVVAWELCQPFLSGLVFDTGDIVATIVGSLLFSACWPFVRRIIASL